MQNSKKANYYLGLDMGTDSIGYAVTDSDYNLLKFKGEPMWGTHVFDTAQIGDFRRSARSARRRLDRRQHRVKLVQMLFAHEIAKVDINFYKRIQESMLYPEDAQYGVSLFADEGFGDKEYYQQYPTIHHLIKELIECEKPHDVRLVYLAIAWLVAHRGHFLHEISSGDLSEILDFKKVYAQFIDSFTEQMPWECDDIDAFGEALKLKCGFKQQKAEVEKHIKPNVGFDLFDIDQMLRLLCGKEVIPQKLFKNDDYASFDKIVLDKSDEDLEPIISELGDDDAELIRNAKKLFDWAVLSTVLQGETYISISKVKTYERYKEDLEGIKKLASKYKKSKKDFEKDVALGYLSRPKGTKRKSQADFCRSVEKFLAGITVDEGDRELYKTICQRAENNMLCTKQVTGENRTIPYQVYLYELNAILDNARKYLDFLNEQDSDGYTVCDKIVSVFKFRVPYYVGPLNEKSERAWFKRKAAGNIYPWNFESLVDLDESEEAFIKRMTNTCQYLPGESVLPQMSLCYESFRLLNEINPVAIDGKRISVELKQKLFEFCLTKKHISKKDIQNFFKTENICLERGITGIDDKIKTSMISHMAFERLISSGKLTEADAERIIERRTFAESKTRFAKWLNNNYQVLSEKDLNYISGLKFKDFGRLSKELLCGIYGAKKTEGTGEAKTILERMWDENVTLMELLSSEYTYSEIIEQKRQEFFADDEQVDISGMLDDMRLSGGVERSVIRTLDVIDDIVKVMGGVPGRIFVEMARGEDEARKTGRTSSRYQQILELYKKCDRDTQELQKQLEELGEADGNALLQKESVFLYYMQLGKSMYTGEPIDLSSLAENYNVDHIYPRSKIEDDSIHNNKVLVESTINGAKSDSYPLDQSIRNNMRSFWRFLKDNGFITPEKYRRLTRSTPFTIDEQWGFVNRQLVETRQSTKAITTILKQKYGASEVVFVKAWRVSEFRHAYDMLKCRSVNDLHHAKDAYLNIVVGNVYHEKFTKTWFYRQNGEVSLNTDAVFADKEIVRDGRVIWRGTSDINRIKKTVNGKNAIHFTTYQFCRKGGLFDQQPCHAAPGLVPRKKGLDPAKYGGYNKATASFFMLAKYKNGKKNEVMLVPVELMFADKVLSSPEFAAEYIADAIGKITGKPVQSVEFPLGLRKLKIGTMFEFDGNFRVTLSGKSSGGAGVLIKPMCPLILGYKLEKYIKHIDRYVQKRVDDPDLPYSERYAKISTDENLQLYDILCSKMKSTVYNKRPNSPSKIFDKGRELFAALDIIDQCKCLQEMLKAFGRMGKCNLELLKAAGGSSSSGVTKLSTSLSNWKKSYSDVRIVDTTASGLYQSKTENLLELL